MEDNKKGKFTFQTTFHKLAMSFTKNAAGLCAMLAGCAPNIPFVNAVHTAPPSIDNRCRGVKLPRLGISAHCVYSDSALRQIRGEPLRVLSYTIADEKNREFVIKSYAWSQPDTLAEVILFVPKCESEVSNVPLAIGDGWMGRLYVTSDNVDSTGILSDYVVVRTEQYELPREHPGCVNGMLAPPLPREPLPAEKSKPSRPLRSRLG